MATPAGKAVVLTCSLAAMGPVSAEGPAHDLMPRGPSAIFMEGMPSRALGTVLIQLAPANIATFSCSVIRLRRSCTRCSTGKAEFLYGGLPESLWLWETPGRTQRQLKPGRINASWRYLYL